MFFDNNQCGFSQLAEKVPVIIVFIFFFYLGSIQLISAHRLFCFLCKLIFGNFNSLV